MNENLYFGKYRGSVTSNKDLLNMGRIRAKVPDIFGDNETGWAMPCMPFGGSGMGFFAVPPEGAGVWIEFEGGDPDYPIWSGCWWGSMAEMPPVLFAPPPPSGTEPKVMIRTKEGSSILIDDSPGVGGITLETSTGQKIILSSTGVEINNGQGASIKISTGVEIDNGQGASIKMTGSQISINDGALEVT